MGCISSSIWSILSTSYFWLLTPFPAPSFLYVLFLRIIKVFAWQGIAVYDEAVRRGVLRV